MVLVVSVIRAAGVYFQSSKLRAVDYNKCTGLLLDKTKNDFDHFTRKSQSTHVSQRLVRPRLHTPPLGPLGNLP